MYSFKQFRNRFNRLQVRTADGRESYFEKFQCVRIIFRSIFFKKINLLVKALNPPFFAVLSSGLNLKQRYFFHEKKLQY